MTERGPVTGLIRDLNRQGRPQRGLLLLLASPWFKSPTIVIVVTSRLYCDKNEKRREGDLNSRGAEHHELAGLSYLQARALPGWAISAVERRISPTCRDNALTFINILAYSGGMGLLNKLYIQNTLFPKRRIRNLTPLERGKHNG